MPTSQNRDMGHPILWCRFECEPTATIHVWVTYLSNTIAVGCYMTDKKSRVFKRHLNRIPPPILWHYTSLEGFQGIVRQQALWATDIRYLNDVSEFIHASELFKEQISKRQAGASNAESVFLGQATDLIENVYSLSQTKVFVTSFSTSNDQLSQWRAYGSGAKGVSLGFNLRRLQIAEAKTSASVFAPCIYSNRQKIAMIDSWLDAYLELLHQMLAIRESAAKDIPIPFKDGVLNDDYLSMIGSEITFGLIEMILDAGRLCALMKHESFSEEKEWRLVIAESRTRSIPSPYPRLSRVGFATLIPYISIPLRPNELRKRDVKNRITAVKVGPNPDSDRAVDAIREFLETNHLVDVEISVSRIPFRAS
jgi:hypothetical protein